MSVSLSKHTMSEKEERGRKKGRKERRKGGGGGLWVRSREQSAHKGTLRGGLRRSRMRSATLLGLGLEWGREGWREKGGGQNGISQRALENPAEHLNEPREGGGRRGWGEGEWPAFWDQFVSFLSPIPPASVLTDVQRRTRAETLVYAHPLAAVTPVRRVNQTNTTILWCTSWRERDGGERVSKVVGWISCLENQNDPNNAIAHYKYIFSCHRKLVPICSVALTHQVYVWHAESWRGKKEKNPNSCNYWKPKQLTAAALPLFRTQKKLSTCLEQ